MLLHNRKRVKPKLGKSVVYRRGRALSSGDAGLLWT